MRKFCFVLFVIFLLFSITTAQEARKGKILSYDSGIKEFYPKKTGLGKYLILTNVDKNNPFYKVAEKLKQFRKAKAILKFDPDELDEISDKIRAANVEYVAFVVTPEIIDINFVYDVLRIARTLDDDPYTDFLYGFITGEDADAAMKFLENIIKAESEKDKMPKKITHFGPSDRNLITEKQNPWIEGYESVRLYHKENKLTDEQLELLKNRRIITNWGHGGPEGIVDSLQAKDIKGLNLYPAVHISGACYTGVTLRSFDASLGSNKVKSRMIKSEESFCLQILNSGVTAYIAAVDPAHGITAGQEFEYLFMNGCTLGEVLKHTYDAMVSSSLKKDYYPKKYIEDSDRGFRDMLDIMLKGASARILFGDPKYQPVQAVKAKPYETKITETEYGQEVEAKIIDTRFFYNFVDVFHSEKYMNRKFKITLEIPEKFGEIKDVMHLEIKRQEQSVNPSVESYMVEYYGNKRLLHIQTDFSYEESLTKGMYSRWAVINNPAKAPKITEITPGPEKVPENDETEKPDDTEPEKTEPAKTPEKPAIKVLPADTDLQKLSYLEVAKYAGTWLAYNAEKVEDTGAIRWAEYEETDKYSYGIYSGAAGIAVYFLNMFNVTDEEKYLRFAEQAANYLEDSAKTSESGIFWLEEKVTRAGVKYTSESSGFYTGGAGIGWFFLKLSELYKNRGDKSLSEKYLKLAKLAANHVIAKGEIKNPKEDEKDCFNWQNSTDTIAGAAGIGLFFIEMFNATKNENYHKAAKFAGNWLIKNATVKDDCASWPSHIGWERIYPNFSHGVSGIGYFFARLYKSTKDNKYKNYLRMSLNYLESVAVKDEQMTKWWHYSGEGEKSFWTGWCHGPAGTAYLYLYCYNLMKEEKYLETAKRSAQFIMQTVQPWDNKGYFWGHSACCGTSSVGNFFVDLFNFTKDKKHLEYANKVGDYLKNLAKIDDYGLKWTNYDNPDKEGKIYYACSFRIGVAGIGNFFLKLHLANKQSSEKSDNLLNNIISFPDALFE